LKAGLGGGYSTGLAGGRARLGLDGAGVVCMELGNGQAIVESARDVPYGDINVQEILRAHTSVVFKGRRAG
jgi:hypothetical protein